MAEGVRGDQKRLFDAIVLPQDHVTAGANNPLPDHETGAPVEVPIAAIGAFVIGPHRECALPEEIVEVGPFEFPFGEGDRFESKTSSPDLAPQGLR